MVQYVGLKESDIKNLIPSDEVKMVYYKNFYDHPLEGHAWYDGRYCLFTHIGYIDGEGDDEQNCTLYQLNEITGQSLVQELAARQLFEDMVGHHCSFCSNRKSFDMKLAIDFEGYFAKNGKRSKYYDLAHITIRNEDLVYIGEFGW